MPSHSCFFFFALCYCFLYCSVLFTFVCCKICISLTRICFFSSFCLCFSVSSNFNVSTSFCFSASALCSSASWDSRIFSANSRSAFTLVSWSCRFFSVNSWSFFFSLPSWISTFFNTNSWSALSLADGLCNSSSLFFKANLIFNSFSLFTALYWIVFHLFPFVLLLSYPLFPFPSCYLLLVNVFKITKKSVFLSFN